MGVRQDEGMPASWKQHPKAALDGIATDLNRQVALLRAAAPAAGVATSKTVKAEEEVVCDAELNTPPRSAF